MEYVKTSLRILGHRAIRAQYKSEEPDLILVGRYGMIWKYDATRYFVMVDSPRIAGRQIASRDSLGPIREGEEVGVIVEAVEALTWLKTLRVSRRTDTQIRLMKERTISH